MVNLSKNIIDLANLLKPKAELFIVGGFVRNSLLNREANDIDLTSSLTLDELSSILNKSKFKLTITNKSFGTAKIIVENEKYEYTTLRQDIYISGKHSPKEIKFVTSPQEDFIRRDFTINAIYYNILACKYLDFANGIEDLSNHIIREISPKTLNFDGERILRLVKYCILLNLKIEKQTLFHAQQNSKNVYDLNKSMLNSYKVFFLSLPLFKRLRAKKILKKLNILNLLN